MVIFFKQKELQFVDVIRDLVNNQYLPGDDLTMVTNRYQITGDNLNIIPIWNTLWFKNNQKRLQI